MDIKMIIQSAPYNNLLNMVKSETHIDINENPVSFIMLNYYSECLKKGEITPDEIMNTLTTDIEKIYKYSLCHFDKYSREPEDDLQEYPIGEELDVNEREQLRKVLPYGRDFLMGDIIEYYLLKNNPQKISIYLKRNRILYAKKYEKEIKEIYSKINTRYEKNS